MCIFFLFPVVATYPVHIIVHSIHIFKESGLRNSSLPSYYSLQLYHPSSIQIFFWVTFLINCHFIFFLLCQRPSFTPIKMYMEFVTTISVVNRSKHYLNVSFSWLNHESDFYFLLLFLNVKLCHVFKGPIFCFMLWFCPAFCWRNIRLYFAFPCSLLGQLHCYRQIWFLWFSL